MSFAGGLTERVAIRRRAADRDALGGAAGAWAEIALVWARSRPVGRSGAEGGAVRGRDRWEVLLRPCDVRVGDRIARVDGELAVTGVTRDPAVPDRVAVAAEAVT